MIYLASPYSDEEEFKEEQRYNDAMLVTVRFLHLQFVVFSPIVYCHPIKIAYKLEGDFNTWKYLNRDFIHTSNMMIVLQLEGWKESIGVQEEIKFAKEIKKVIRYATLDELIGGIWAIDTLRKEP